MNRQWGITHNFLFKLVQRAVKESDRFWQFRLWYAREMCQIPARVFPRDPQSLSSLHELWWRDDSLAGDDNNEMRITRSRNRARRAERRGSTAGLTTSLMSDWRASNGSCFGAEAEVELAVAMLPKNPRV